MHFKTDALLLAITMQTYINGEHHNAIKYGEKEFIIGVISLSN
ncbi:Hypothetical protein ETEE_3767 [Edwardsiella anguillarum ET080813]|uniref:Uncharacterized protein n=1 Tax=Edwardsiella anguillarum ET080813 TaxID=667120 RepID=A0A076LXM3_9GAMM|nr:Hypothetical protein ETEE_3767 [Edwardsiella anguillarum ET080813]